MNIFKHNLASSKRHGLSVIEVLTSIVVALIGVFGVLAMIPFSVQQTQSGLDQDAATSMARNSLSSFEASGYKIVADNGDFRDGELGWVDRGGFRVRAVPVPPDPTLGYPVPTATPGALLCIDPLGITEGGMGPFPFNSTAPFNDPTSPLAMPRVNLVRPGGTEFEVADARRMFRLTDDLVFKESDDPTVTDSDLLGPVQIFNEAVVGGAASFVNRQSTGAVSWCAVVQPIVSSATAEEVDSYKFNVLVFKDRITDTTAPESAMVSATVTATSGSPLSRVTLGDTVASSEVRRNDWVMLINQAAGATPVALRTKIAFARISNLYDVDESKQARPRRGIISNA